MTLYVKDKKFYMRVVKLAVPVVIQSMITMGISELSSIAGYFIFMVKKIGYRIKDIVTSCKGLYGQYVRFCIPVLISDTILGIGNSTISVTIGHIGFSFVAANEMKVNQNSTELILNHT